MDSRTSNDTAVDLLAYVRGLGRVEMTRQEIAEDLASLGKHGAGWPNASATHWARKLDALLAEGSLRVSQGGFICLPNDELQPVQQSLF